MSEGGGVSSLSSLEIPAGERLVPFFLTLCAQFWIVVSSMGSSRCLQAPHLWELVLCALQGAHTARHDKKGKGMHYEHK